jgi:hypothetical protein
LELKIPDQDLKGIVKRFQVSVVNPTTQPLHAGISSLDQEGAALSAGLSKDQSLDINLILNELRPEENYDHGSSLTSPIEAFIAARERSLKTYLELLEHLDGDEQELHRAFDNEWTCYPDYVQLFINYWTSVRTFTTYRLRCPNPDPMFDRWMSTVSSWKFFYDFQRRNGEHLPAKFLVYPDTRAQGTSEVIKGAT